MKIQMGRQKDRRLLLTKRTRAPGFNVPGRAYPTRKGVWTSFEGSLSQISKVFFSREPILSSGLIFQRVLKVLGVQKRKKLFLL